MIFSRILFIVVILIFESKADDSHDAVDVGQAAHEHSRLRDSKHVHDKE